MLDLYNNQYSRQILKDNIYDINFLVLLKTQKIDATFAVRYILNPKYDLDDKYTQFNPDLIIRLQPHIKMVELQREKMNYDSDDDSVSDFEYVSKKG
jgi:hypothetical protein